MNARTETAERIRVTIVVGSLTGAFGGFVSRMAMGALRVTSSDSVRGRLSDDGFVIGRVTLRGTHNLMTIGAAFGIIAAAVFPAMARWLIGPRWFRLLTTAAGSGAVVGSALVHPDGIDFTLLTPQWFAIGLFVAFPAVFAVALGRSLERVAAPGHWTGRGWRRWVVPAVLLLVFPPTIPVAVVTAAALTVTGPWRRAVAVAGSHRHAAYGWTVRSLWAGAAIAGGVALTADVMALT